MTAREDGTATFKAFARILGERSPSYVTQLKEAGRLVLTEDGKRVRVAESRKLIAETRDASKDGVSARHAAKRASAAATAPADRQGAAGALGAGEEGDGDASTAYTDPIESSHARRKAKALADKAEADARKALRDEQIELGRLLEAEVVEHAVRGAVVIFRGALENLPNTIAPELAAIADESRVRVVLAEALDHALEELARKFGQLGKAPDA